MSEKSFEQIYADYKAAGEQQALQESAGAKRVYRLIQTKSGSSPCAKTMTET